MNKNSVAQNASLLTGAYILQKIFAFVYFTLIARYIGPEDIGKYVFAVSLTTLLAIFIDLGLTPVMIRELAKNNELTKEYSRVILTAKIILGVSMYLIALLLVRLLHKDPITITMVGLTGVAMVLDSLSLTLWGILRAHHNLFHEAMSTIGNQMIITLAGLLGLYMRFPLPVLALALVFGSAFSFIYALVITRMRGFVSFKPYLHFQTLFKQLRESLAFALAGIFTRIYSYMDQVLLSLMISNIALGWYSVAYKIAFAFQFLPSAFAAAIYPAMSAARKNDPIGFQRLFEKSMYFLSLMAIPLAVGVFVIAPEAIRIFYGARFLESVTPLRILIFSLPAVFLSFPVGSVLNSSNKQHINTINLGITMVINVGLNLLLIPKFEYIGAAIAATVSLYYLLFSNIYFISSATTYDKNYLIKKISGITLSSLLMGVVAWFMLSINLPLIITIACGAIIYIGSVYLSGVVSKNDTKELINSILRKPPSADPI